MAQLRKGKPDADVCACGEHAWASVRNGRVTLVDAADAHLLRTQWWRSIRLGYVAGGPASRSVLLHRVIMAAPAGKSVDHVNRNSSDNRRSNLRVCTQSQNAGNQPKRRRNTSGFKGVFFHPQTGRWRARIKVRGAGISLGLYDSPDQASRAYDEAAQEYFGEFALINRRAVS